MQKKRLTELNLLGETDAGVVAMAAKIDEMGGAIEWPSEDMVVVFGADWRRCADALSARGVLRMERTRRNTRLELKTKKDGARSKDRARKSASKPKKKDGKR